MKLIDIAKFIDKFIDKIHCVIRDILRIVLVGVVFSKNKKGSSKVDTPLKDQTAESLAEMPRMAIKKPSYLQEWQRYPKRLPMASKKIFSHGKHQKVLKVVFKNLKKLQSTKKQRVHAPSLTRQGWQRKILCPKQESNSLPSAWETTILITGGVNNLYSKS